MTSSAERHLKDVRIVATGNLMKSSREKCKVLHLSWNDSYTLGENWLSLKSGGFSGFQAEWADPALTPQGSCVLRYIRSNMAGRSRKVLFPNSWHWWGCTGHTIQSGTWTLQRDGRKLESVHSTFWSEVLRGLEHLIGKGVPEAYWGRWKEG